MPQYQAQSYHENYCEWHSLPLEICLQLGVAHQHDERKMPQTKPRDVTILQSLLCVRTALYERTIMQSMYDPCQHKGEIEPKKKKKQKL